MTGDTYTSTRHDAERRWHRWASLIGDTLGWPRCTGLPWEYVVCDMRDEGGRLEMVHIDGLSDADIRKQIANIIAERI